MKSLRKSQMTFLECIYEWFCGEWALSEDSFDKWYNKACETVLDILRNHYIDIRYGKAQKIVNMTLKNMYCLQGAEKYDTQFENCHIALDSFTLEWFWRTCGEERDSKQKIRKGKIGSWSNLDYSEAEADIYREHGKTV